MNQEDLLVLLVIFVLGFVVSQMMSGRLVEGSESNNVGKKILKSKFKFSNLTPDDTNPKLMACLTPNGVKEFPCDISDDSDNQLVTINMNTGGEMVDRTEVMRNKCNDVFYNGKNNVWSIQANQCLQCVVDNNKKCCNTDGCSPNAMYVPGFKLKYDLDDYSHSDWNMVSPPLPPPPPIHDDCCDITNKKKCNNHYIGDYKTCKWHDDTGQCLNIRNKGLFTNYYEPCPPSSDTSQSDTSENN